MTIAQTQITMIKGALIAPLITCLFSIGQAWGAPSSGDYFGHTTKIPATTHNAAPGTYSMNGIYTPTTNEAWFEKLDNVVATHMPSPGDKVILTRTFNQELERVQEWTKVAHKIARQYREASQQIKAMQIPASMPAVKEYRDLTADWYLDAASIYEDLIRPRNPAKSMEDLDAQLDEIKTRSQGLAQNHSNLVAMDLSLRKTFKVHLARYSDSLSQYVRSGAN